MVGTFSKENIKQIYQQLDTTKQDFEIAFKDFEKLYGMVSDIHENKTKFDKKHKIISDATREAIILSVDNNIIVANKAAYSMLGYDPDLKELVGKHLEKFVFEKDIAIIESHFKKKSTEVYEIRIIHKIGYLVPVEVQSKSVEYDGKEANISTCIDISKRKEEELKRRDTELELKKTKAQLGAFLLKKGYISRGQLKDGLALQEDLPRLLGDILINLGYITNEQLEEALNLQNENRLGCILLRKNYITQEQLDEVLNYQHIQFKNLGIVEEK